jgi:hypothetical protein
MSARSAWSGIGACALGVALALSSAGVASASSNKGTSQHKAKPKKPSAKRASSGCPTAAQMTATTGKTFPPPKTSSSSGTVSCNYDDPTTSVNFVIVLTPAAGTTASELKTVSESEASAEKATATRLSGFGNAAYIYTLSDASTNASGIATTTLTILAGSKLIDITAESTVAQVKAVARLLLAR